MRHMLSCFGRFGKDAVLMLLRVGLRPPSCSWRVSPPPSAYPPV